MIIFGKNGHRVEASRALGHGTNNIGELYAVWLALEILEEHTTTTSAQRRQKVHIMTDSKYVYGQLALDNKTNKNRSLVSWLKTAIKEQRATHDIVFHWVGGHAGVEPNERADALATTGVSESVKRGITVDVTKRPPRQAGAVFHNTTVMPMDEERPREPNRDPAAAVPEEKRDKQPAKVGWSGVHSTPLRIPCPCDGCRPSSHDRCLAKSSWRPHVIKHLTEACERIG